MYMSSEESLSPEMQKILDKHANTNYDSIIRQIEAEYSIAWMHQISKIQQNLARLKLYNNQKKDKDVVGDPLLFTVHQTVLASLYQDQLMVSFEGREEGDLDIGNNLNKLAEFDYEKMGKDVNDYMLDWDTLFFGRGLQMLMEFDRSKDFMCPIGEIWDPMTFLRDPKALSVNGDMRGRGSMRFGGREIWLNRGALSEQYGYFDYKGLRSSNEVRSLLDQAQQERDSAQNLEGIFNRDVETNLGDNGVIAGLQWLTHWKGKKVMVTLSEKRRRVIKYVELKDRWPLIDRPMYPHSHSWDGTSIPDLVEDKQRQRSVAINLGLQAMKSDLYPMYLYDEERIKNKGDLTNFGFNKFVGIMNNDGKDIQGAVRPLNKPSLQWNMVNFILETLDASAQKATATPDMQQGSVESQKRTLGELNLVSAKVDTRYSLTAKVFGWSEREYWRTWYQLYKEHFQSGIDEKIIRIAGSLGAKWRPLKREDIVAHIDPDIMIESKAVSESKMVRERILFQGFGQVVLADPTANKRFYNKKLARLNGLSNDEIELLFPPTIEEIQAAKENEELNKNKLQQVDPNDDHATHRVIHVNATETAAKKAHLHAHDMAELIQRNQPELFPQLQAQQDQTNPTLPGGSGSVLPTGMSKVLSQTPSAPATGSTAPIQ